MDMPACLIRFECDPQEIDPRDAKTKSITPPVNGRDQLKYRYVVCKTETLKLPRREQAPLVSDAGHSPCF